MSRLEVTRRQSSDDPQTTLHSPWFAWVCGGLVLIGAWSYAPVFLRLMQVWSGEPDYSHGYLVIPVALGLLWARRDRLPAWGCSQSSLATGLGVILFSQTLRVIGDISYSEPLEQGSLVAWTMGVAMLLGGWRLWWWSLPALGFLLFMIPLPYRLESALSFPLQSIATSLSVWWLQLLGQPAIAHGHIIRIGEIQLEVAQACSGLRMFMSIAAIGAAFAILFERPRWHRLLLFSALGPIAIVANSLRIVMTGLLSRWVSADVGHAFTHDFSGWVMIPMAVGMFLAWNWYLNRLFLEVVPADLYGARAAEKTSVAGA
jgi:exosortase